MRPTLRAFSVLLAAALTAACGEADQNGGNNGGKAGSGGATGGASTGGAGTGASSTGGGGAGGMDTGGTTTGGGGPCGGLDGTTCETWQYCDYTEDKCGAADGSGVCTPRPDVCDAVLDPVCACDGRVYDNACEAAASGIDIQTLGGCPPPVGEFQCGPGFCDKTDELCQVDMPDVPGGPIVYTCIPLPPNCQVPDATCACLSDMKCGQLCMLADGSFTLTCSGG